MPRSVRLWRQRQLEAVLSEMGRLAIQAGEIINAFTFPMTGTTVLPTRLAFAEVKQAWIGTFYPDHKPAG